MVSDGKHMVSQEHNKMLSQVNESEAFLELTISKKKKSLAYFINYCLNHRKYGYYHNNVDISPTGDFITAPEVSQLFGETIAIWILYTINKIKNSQTKAIVEYGPGNGTLTRDVIMTMLKIDSSLLEKCHFYLVESSQKLVSVQKQTLKALSKKVAISWINHPLHLPKTTCIIYANEFLDVLPIHQWKHKKNKWYKSFIRFNNDIKKIQQTFIPTIARPFNRCPRKYSLYENYLDDNDIIETSPWRDRWWLTKTRHIKKYGGAILIIDYGYVHKSKSLCVGSTLQAMNNHVFKDPFENIGVNDITSHVDFSRLKELVPQQLTSNTRLKCQSEFLCEYGIVERLKSLINSNTITEKQKISLNLQVQRLISDTEMGDLFKVIEVWSNPLINSHNSFNYA